jgi:hypothetical protein
MAEELERGGGGGVRSEVEGVERPSWRTGGDRRSQVDGCEALLRGPSGGESTRRRAPDETRARLERGRGDEREINREREERSREPSHGVVLRWEVVIAVVVSRWCCGGLSVWSTTMAQMGDLR